MECPVEKKLAYVNNMNKMFGTHKNCMPYQNIPRHMRLPFHTYFLDVSIEQMKNRTKNKSFLIKKETKKELFFRND